MPTATITNQHLQDGFLRLAVTDTEFLSLVVGELRPELFSSRLTRRLVEICFNYYAQFKEAPGDHFHDELVQVLSDLPDEDVEEYIQYVRRLQTISPNKPYVLRRVGDFVKAREYESAAIAFADLVADGKFDEAQNRMYQALRAGIEQQEIGLDYLTDTAGIGERGERPEYLLGTGMPALDAKIGGYRRSQLVVFLGSMKGMKSWSLIHLGRIALLRGLNVLHVTHELSREEMELRYDMMFSMRGNRRVGEEIEYAECRDGRYARARVKVRSIYDSAAVKRARAAVRRFGGRLIVKKYPMGQCTTAELERYMHYLETYQGFVPDVFLNDYADIMKHANSKDELRHQINSTYIWCKGIADEKNIVVATASQVTRKAIGKKFVRMGDVAEDIRKVANCDVMLAICQTEEDVQAGLARLAVLANRSGPQDVYCSFSPCLHVGQFAMSSWDTLEMEMGEDAEDG